MINALSLIFEQALLQNIYDSDLSSTFERVLTPNIYD